MIRGRGEWTGARRVQPAMSPEHDPDEIDARLARLEQRVEDLHDKLGSSQKGGGGIGCLGIILFVVLFLKVDEVLEAVQALAS